MKKLAGILVGTALLAWLVLGCASSRNVTDVSSVDRLEGDSSSMDQVATEDDAGSDDSAEPDPGPVAQPTILVKGPWLQWVGRHGFYVMAESRDEVPLKIEVAVSGEPRGVFWSTPFLPDGGAGVLLPPVLDGWLHEVEVTGMEPGESFVVTVTNSGDQATGTMPVPGESLKMVMFGDNRLQSEEHRMVVDAIMKYRPELVLNTGDLVMVGGEKDQWTQFFQIEKPLLSSAFYYPVFGNHEAFLGQGYFSAFFHTENNYLDEGNWYTVVGDVGLMALNQYEQFDWSDPGALAWLDTGLASLRKEAKWVFATLHHPLYTFSHHGPWLDGRTTVQPLFEKYQVDMVLSGHNHCYEHFIVNNIHYIVTGGGGAPLYAIEQGPPEEQDLRVAVGSFYHYLRLDVTPGSVKVSVVKAENGKIFEAFTLQPH